MGVLYTPAGQDVCHQDRVVCMFDTGGQGTGYFTGSVSFTVPFRSVFAVLDGGSRKGAVFMTIS